jgi:hypothetical protein
MRDPKIDPQPGDVVCRFAKWTRIVTQIRRGMVYYVCPEDISHWEESWKKNLGFLGGNPGPTNFQNCSIEHWRRWCSSKEEPAWVYAVANCIVEGG